MKEICADRDLIAYCGLYCGACKKYLKEKCPGCKKIVKAVWCKIRTCCIENSYTSCADCQIVKDLKDCKKFNNVVSKLFALVFRSDRFACIALINKKGNEEYVKEMADKGIMTIKR